MSTQGFIDVIETMIDEWPDEMVVAEDFIKTIEEQMDQSDIESFINDYGGCCLECALNKYFKESEGYDTVVKEAGQ